MGCTWKVVFIKSKVWKWRATDGFMEINIHKVLWTLTEFLKNNKKLFWEKFEIINFERFCDFSL